MNTTKVGELRVEKLWVVERVIFAKAKIFLQEDSPIAKGWILHELTVRAC